MKKRNQLSTFFLVGALMAVFIFSCSKGKSKENVMVQVTLRAGDEILMDVRGTASEVAGKAHARISTQDISGPEGGTVKTNTVGVVANTSGQGDNEMKTLVITLPDVTGPGRYDIVALKGLFIYSDSRDGMKGWEVSPKAETSRGIIHIEAIGNKDLPALGRPVKGTFSVTAESQDGTLRQFTGTFDGGM